MSRYQSNSSSRRRAQDVLALPRGFISIRELLDDNHGLGQTVSVIGVVKDYKLPIPTKGSGEQCISYSHHRALLTDHAAARL